MRVVSQPAAPAPQKNAPPSDQHYHDSDALDEQFTDADFIDYLDMNMVAMDMVYPPSSEQGLSFDFNSPVSLSENLRASPFDVTLNHETHTAVHQVALPVDVPATTVSEMTDFLSEAAAVVNMTDEDVQDLTENPKITLTLKPRENWQQSSDIDVEPTTAVDSTTEGDSKPFSSRGTHRRPASHDNLYYELSEPPPKQRKEVEVVGVVERNKRNAIQARVNRKKKKEHLEILQDEVDGLQRDNLQLRSTNEQLQKQTTEMANEILYLRNVLANESSISDLLRNIGPTSSIRLRTSVTTADTAVTPGVAPQMGGGVCLHVDHGEVSVEFCEKCARLARDGAT